jgi:hypothetical protein
LGTRTPPRWIDPVVGPCFWRSRLFATCSLARCISSSVTGSGFAFTQAQASSNVGRSARSPTQHLLDVLAVEELHLDRLELVFRRLVAHQLKGGLGIRYVILQRRVG